MLYPVKWNLFNIYIEHLEVEGTGAACWPLCQILDVVSVKTAFLSLPVFICENIRCVKKGIHQFYFIFCIFQNNKLK